MKGQHKFLIIIIFLYLAVALFDQAGAREAFSGFVAMFLRIVSVLGVVFVVLVLTNLYFDKKRIGKYLGASSGKRGWFYAVVSGILVSGPPYVLYPFLGELKKQGMKNSLLAVFLYNRNVKIPFLPAMVYYFGFGFTAVLSFYIIAFSLLNGKLVSFLAREKRR